MTKPPSTPSTASATNGKIGRAQWLALAAALLGWMFDGMEMGVFSMVGKPALEDLLTRSAETALSGDALKTLVGFWFGVILACFLVGAATGGVLFGWLGDRIGRVRAMTLSVLTYALFTGLCGLSQNGTQLGILRFIASLGMGGEWSLGVALVMEAWPNRSRAFMAGLIGAAGNFGYMLVGFIGLGLASGLQTITGWLTKSGLPEDWVAALTQHQGWRLLMVVGTLPALLTFLIRMFVPESESWEQEKKSGATSHWSAVDLLGVLVGAAGPGLMIYLWSASEISLGVKLGGTVFCVLLATGGYLYPVLRYLQRLAAAHPKAQHHWQPTVRRMLLAAGLSGVALLGTWGSMQWAPSWADQLSEPTKISNPGQHAKEWTQICAALGAILGTITAAMVGDWIGRRITYSILCVLSIISLLWLYRAHTEFDNSFLLATFIAGACSASFYGWLPLYLPELFRTQIRATGQGFGFNFGRIIAAIGTLQTGSLFAPKIELFNQTFDGGYPFACAIMTAIYLVGIVLIWFGPETLGKPLPE